jgi:tripartite ATP-independent transporter DctM subunit
VAGFTFWLSLSLALAIGVPVAFSLAVSGFTVAFLALDGLSFRSVLILFAQTLYGGADSFILLALPLFFFAGALMESGGISDRLVRLGLVLIGWVRGGLSMVAVVAGIFLSGISGSASSDAAAIGSILIPAMKKRGYPAGYASAVAASAGALGPIIPPSILLVVYGSLADVSVTQLFLGGVVPGLICAAALMAVCSIIAIRRGYPKEAFPSLHEARSAFTSALIPLAGPFIILGGIFGGIFTATESAAIAVLYSLVVSVYIYRALSWRQVFDIAYESAIASARVLIIIAAAAFIGWVLAREQVPQQIASQFLGISKDPLIVLLIINVMILLFGALMDELALAVILLPTLLPIVTGAGIDLIFFGVILIVNFAIGTVMPPVGNCLFVVSAVSQTPFEKIVPEVWPFILAMIAVLAVLCVFPDLILWLPKLMR